LGERLVEPALLLVDEAEVQVRHPRRRIALDDARPQRELGAEHRRAREGRQADSGEGHDGRGPAGARGEAVGGDRPERGGEGDRPRAREIGVMVLDERVHLVVEAEQAE
jgi:hypothetical protein